MQGVCPCSNPVITRPGPLKQRRWREGRARKGMKGWTGAKGGARGFDNNRDQKRRLPA